MTDAFTKAPSDLLEIISSQKESEYASLTAKHVPISNPLFHYFRSGDATIDIATGLAYPAKADRVRKIPQVGLLMGPAVHANDPVAILESGTPDTRELVDQPVVIVAALGAVRDADLQANTDKYVDRFIAEHPNVGPQDWETMKTMTNYWVRIWVECTPARVYWWPTGKLDDEKPKVWEAPQGAVFPTSDPAPAGKGTPRANWPAEPWLARAEQVLPQFPQPVLTSLSSGSYPIPFPCRSANIVDDGFLVEMSRYNPSDLSGKASLSFGALATFIGELDQQERGLLFRVERLIGNLPSIFQNEGEQFDVMAERQQRELDRRGQPMPKIRKGFWKAGG